MVQPYERSGRYSDEGTPEDGAGKGWMERRRRAAKNIQRLAYNRVRVGLRGQGMKGTVKDVRGDSLGFPKMLRDPNDGHVVLFFNDKGKGVTVVSGNEPYEEVGTFFDGNVDSLIAHFTETFSGVVELSNG